MNLHLAAPNKPGELASRIPSSATCILITNKPAPDIYDNSVLLFPPRYARLHTMAWPRLY